MKLPALVIFASFCVLCGHLPAAESKRPNIVLIFADDLGWRDTGFTGSDFYETPNLDRLAKEGMVFTDAYAGAGNCQPSRACLLSGQYTPRHGVTASFWLNPSWSRSGAVRETGLRIQPWLAKWYLAFLGAGRFNHIVIWVDG